MGGRNRGNRRRRQAPLQHVKEAPGSPTASTKSAESSSHKSFSQPKVKKVWVPKLVQPKVTDTDFSGLPSRQDNSKTSGNSGKPVTEETVWGTSVPATTTTMATRVCGHSCKDHDKNHTKVNSNDHHKHVDVECWYCQCRGHKMSRCPQQLCLACQRDLEADNHHRKTQLVELMKIKLRHAEKDSINLINQLTSIWANKRMLGVQFGAPAKDTVARHVQTTNAMSVSDASAPSTPSTASTASATEARVRLLELQLRDIAADNVRKTQLNELMTMKLRNAEKDNINLLEQRVCHEGIRLLKEKLRAEREVWAKKEAFLEQELAAAKDDNHQLLE
ncbi:unnamed protein product [Vitrella brassicaformis CCMP3155]|uniref:Uncharacterized protein n=1 Tax=Vitrella brassicaformis (strain CCMP3155) TaxID=1169540 RepID=A0A0G4GJY3_VITBC|nr:unnamed protein product [Vitrella brassicaformis CCMP3155]|eukprot:CEM30214.1 unnamed protein product [Vitrella brassicaformis CCMP3155]